MTPTALDRLIEAVPDDGPVPHEAQVELVEALMGRPVDWLCPTCCTETDPDGFCGLCGHQVSIQNNNRPEPQTCVGSRGSGQEV